MTMRVTAPLARRARAFAADIRGVAAVEMAFVAPVALILFSLIVASGQTLNAWRRTNAVVHTVTDLVSRTPDNGDTTISSAEDLNQSDLITDLALSQLVLYPNDPTNLQIVMTEIKINTSNNTGTVVWSQAYNGGTPTPCNTVFNLNSSITAAGATYMVVGGASYTFQPLGVELNLPSMTLSASDFLTIRYANQIIVTNVTDTTTFKQCS